MTVFFIGAGPGAPDLVTVRALRLIERCPVCLYAGSLVPREVIAAAPADARVLDTSSMTLGEIMSEIKAAHAQGQDVARVHSGDPSIYGAIGEQMRKCADAGIPCEIVPGVPAFAAAAAALKRELTLPGVSQTIILTRTGGKASPMPDGEQLEELARSGATLAIHLSVRRLADIRRALEPHYGADCPVAVVYRASWPDQRIIMGTLADITSRIRTEKITRTAIILVGRVLDAQKFPDSALYDPKHHHLLRPKARK